MCALRMETRARVGLEVAYEEPGRQVFYPALNLSSSGVFLVSDQPPELGVQVCVVVSLPPDGLFLRLQGSVVRHSGSSEPQGFAVAFVDVDDRTRADLRAFVRCGGTGTTV